MDLIPIPPDKQVILIPLTKDELRQLTGEEEPEDWLLGWGNKVSKWEEKREEENRKKHPLEHHKHNLADKLWGKDHEIDDQVKHLERNDAIDMIWDLLMNEDKIKKWR